ncbi:hypothetical protein [Saccharomonospora piscinae]|uniref:hypothetical protein n=1 Tax=Saccharomonospora piscinae TaxID=687388 RepID=UPI000467A59C|nr:hypothetical protein [Saccharomonospora piscinae]
MSLTVHEDQIADFGLYLSTEAAHVLPKIEQLARDEGMSDHGFNGLLEPLGEIVNGEASVLVGTAFSLMQRKLCELGDALIDVAGEYGHVEEDNRSLIERNGLSGDTDEDIGTGTGYGYGDNYDRHTELGTSKFHYTELDITDIGRDDTSYSDDLDTGGVLSVLDWIWSEFDVDGGKGFTDSLIAPLAGNYNSIAANGDAWRNVGTNFGLLAANMGSNAATLAAEHWEGEAASAFEQFVDVFWQKGAVWAGEQLGEFVAQGFEKISEVSQQIAQLAIEAINLIIRVARRIATKAVPVIGWAWTAIESASKWVGKVFGVDIDDLYDDIVDIIDTAKAVFALFDSIETIVSTMEEYFATLQELVATVETIPEIGSLSDAASTAGTITEHADALGEQKETIEEESDKADDALAELDDLANEAEEKAS